MEATRLQFDKVKSTKKEKEFQNDPKKIRLEGLRDLGHIYSHSDPLKVIGWRSGMRCWTIQFGTAFGLGLVLGLGGRDGK